MCVKQKISQNKKIPFPTESCLLGKCVAIVCDFVKK